MLNREEENPDKPLSREELERERPQTKPWDINPEIVPKGHYYFEVNICFIKFTEGNLNHVPSCESTYVLSKGRQIVTKCFIGFTPCCLSKIFLSLRLLV